MGKLHQTLAVEDAKSNNFKNVVKEATNTFNKKDHLLQGRIVEQKSKLSEDDENYPEFPDLSHSSPVAETVIGKIEWVLHHATEYFNLSAQKDEANTHARADLVIRDKVIVSDLPAVTLLFIENKMKTIRELITQSKTLDAAKNWEKYEAQNHVYKTDPTQKVIKQKLVEWITAVPSTDKHPAQVKEIIVDKIRAVSTATDLSGFLPTEEKATLLMRCDEIIQAAKQARQTANDVEVKTVDVSTPIFSYLMKGQ